MTTVLAFAAFQPWVVLLGSGILVAGFGAAALSIRYLARHRRAHVTTILSLMLVALAAIPIGIAGGFIALYGLDLNDSVGR